VDGYNLLAATITEFSDDVEAVIDQSDGLGDTWVAQQSSGVRKAQIDQKGFYDDAANGVVTALVGNNGVSRILTYALEGNTAGKKFVGYTGAMETKVDRIAARGQLHKLNCSYMGNGQVNEGVILHPYAGEATLPTGNTTLTSVDNGAATTTGAVFYVEVGGLSLGGYTNWRAILLNSADNITFGDLTPVDTFTITATPTAQTAVITGSILRYLAVRWDMAGAGAAPAVTFFAGAART